MASNVLAGNAFRKMVEAGVKCMNGNGKIILSGCGATGRLSILLESIWRRFFAETREKHPDIYEK